MAVNQERYCAPVAKRPKGYDLPATKTDTSFDLEEPPTL
jgi:hypothetical protein